MHTHTAPTSRCAVMTPEELAEGLCEAGYAGAVLTNHFFGGNSGVDRTLPWEDFVAAYERDLELCREAAKKHDLDIIFGVEEHIYGGLEVLCYGVTPKLLKDNPVLRERRLEEWSEILHGAGALMIQAHPYRERGYISEPGVLPLGHIDGIEIYNAGNEPVFNERARAYADAHPDLILTSGADAHGRGTVGIGGIAASERISDERELVALLRSGRYELIV